MLSFIYLAGTISLICADQLKFSPADEVKDDHLWAAYKAAYGKRYTRQEEPERRAQWQRNAAAAAAHNLAADMGEYSFSLGVNEYADLTPSEYQQHLTGYRSKGARRAAGAAFLAPHGAAIPDSWDWRQHGYVTPVKNQGACGSCWAFSATGALEGQHFRQTGEVTMVPLSEQNLVDCSGNWGNNGCNGGLMDQAFSYIKDNKGIDTETAYPYTARDGACKFSNASVGATDAGFVDIPSGDEEALKAAVATVGPIAVAIDAGHISFQLYKHGVYWSYFCSSTSLDHGVLVVGYGSENGKDYWLVKNSWGESWGAGGYIKMARNMNNMCGIATQASYPLV